MGLIEPLHQAWVATLSAGPVWENTGQTQTFFLAPEIEKTYAARKSTHTMAAGEFFVGLQKSLDYQLLGQLGLAIAAAGNAKFSGEIWDDADPAFNNYNYNYTVQHAHLAVKGKLLWDRGYWFTPWLSASVGVGFNRAYGFDNTPVIFEALPNANFTNHTTTAFTYTLGIGVQKTLSEHWQTGIGYEFTDWGKSQLGRAEDQTLNSGIALNHLYTNGLLLNLSYIA